VQQFQPPDFAYPLPLPESPDTSTPGATSLVSTESQCFCHWPLGGAIVEDAPRLETGLAAIDGTLFCHTSPNAQNEDATDIECVSNPSVLLDVSNIVFPDMATITPTLMSLGDETTCQTPHSAVIVASKGFHWHTENLAVSAYEADVCKEYVVPMANSTIESVCACKMGDADDDAERETASEPGLDGAGSDSHESPCTSSEPADNEVSETHVPQYKLPEIPNFDPNECLPSSLESGFINHSVQLGLSMAMSGVESPMPMSLSTAEDTCDQTPTGICDQTPLSAVITKPKWFHWPSDISSMCPQEESSECLATSATYGDNGKVKACDCVVLGELEGEAMIENDSCLAEMPKIDTPMSLQTSVHLGRNACRSPCNTEDGNMSYSLDCPTTPWTPAAWCLLESPAAVSHAQSTLRRACTFRPVACSKNRY
jgi:hypothetical protein